MTELIKNLLKDYQPKHSQFQIDNFIIGNQGCNWSKYKQALREIDGRYNSLIGQKEDLELFDLKRVWRWPFGRKAQIRAIRRKRDRQTLADNIAETERELRRFVEIAVKLKERIGKLDYEKRKVLESDSWRQ